MEKTFVLNENETGFTLNVEVYKENGKKYVYIAEDFSSGMKFEIKNNNEIGKCVTEYISNTYGEII